MPYIAHLRYAPRGSGSSEVSNHGTYFPARLQQWGVGDLARGAPLKTTASPKTLDIIRFNPTSSDPGPIPLDGDPIGAESITMPPDFCPKLNDQPIGTVQLVFVPTIVRIRAQIGSTRTEIAAVREVIARMRARIGSSRIKSDHIATFGGNHV